MNAGDHLSVTNLIEGACRPTEPTRLGLGSLRRTRKTDFMAREEKR